MTHRRSASRTTVVQARPEAVFRHLDDPKTLGAHMEKPSIMMLGPTMKYDLNEAGGRSVGSVIKMTGSIFGFKMYLEEVVIVRLPPLRKTWETRGPIRLLVVGAYRMGFRIKPCASGCMVTVQIDYDLPDGLLGRILGSIFGRSYANWCVGTIAAEADALGSRLTRTA